MKRLLHVSVGACALLLVGCKAETDNPSPGTPPAQAMTDSKAVFELGKTV